MEKISDLEIRKIYLQGIIKKVGKSTKINKIIVILIIFLLGIRKVIMIFKNNKKEVKI